MILLTITSNDAGRRLDRYLAAQYPHLPVGLLQRWIREKKIRLNGRHQHAASRLCVDDVIKLFVSHDVLEQGSKTPHTLPERAELNIVYEDEHIIIVNKPAGLSVHADDHAEVNTLIGHIQAHCKNTDAALAHRLDKNTSGILVAAKTGPALRALNEAFAERNIEKTYLALVVGTPRRLQDKLAHFLRRDISKKHVYVYNKPIPDGKKAILHYITITQSVEHSLLEITLETGRTHQIRAQLAHIGHPLVGDGKYGKPHKDFRGQALCAFRLHFFNIPYPLAYLNGQAFEIAPPTWAE